MEHDEEQQGGDDDDDDDEDRSCPPICENFVQGSRLRKCREVSDGALGNVLIDGPDLRAVVVDGG